MYEECLLKKLANPVNLQPVIGRPIRPWRLEPPQHESLGKNERIMVFPRKWNQTRMSFHSLLRQSSVRLTYRQLYLKDTPG
jgi:hypothetical protein